MSRKNTSILLFLLPVFLFVSCDDGSDDELVVIPDEISENAYYLYYDIHPYDVYPELEEIEEIHTNYYLATQLDERLEYIHAFENHSYILGQLMVCVDTAIVTNPDPVIMRFNNNDLDYILHNYPPTNMEEESWHLNGRIFLLDFDLYYNPQALSGIFESKPGVHWADPNSFVSIPENMEGIELEIIDGTKYRFEFYHYYINQPSTLDGRWIIEVEDGEAHLVSYTQY